MGTLNFKNYDDAKRAERIFEEYRRELEARGLSEKALGLVEQHKTCDSLDIALDKLTSAKRGCSRKLAPIDYEQSGL